MSDVTEENPTPTVVKVSPRLISGVLNANNKDAVDWSSHGLLAYGSQNNIVVVGCAGTALVQTLHGGQRHDITRIRWSRHLHYHDRVRPYTLRLAAADVLGVVTVWNVATGDIKAELAQPGHKTVIDMHWMAFNDASYPLLLVLYDQSYLVLWDTEREVLVWKKDFSKEINGKFTAFSVDPFTEAAIAFVSYEYIWLLDDLTPARPPQNPLKKLEITIPPPPGTGSAAQTPTENPRKSRLLSGMQAMFQGGTARGQQGNVRDHETDEKDGTECLSMMHSAAFRDHLFFVYQKHIVIVDISIQQVIGTVHTERNHIGFFAVRECRITGRLLCLHETGVITVRQRKQCDRTQENRRSSDVTYPLNEIRHDHDIQYELICSSEAYRMIHRNSKIVAFAISPVAECRAAVVLMDGRTLFYQLRDKAVDAATEKPRLVISSNFEALSTVPHCMKMCPPVTFKNWRTYRPLLACAVATGNIQVINVATGQVERNICVHTTPVRGIEWTSLTSFLSFANATLQVTNQQNSNVKNELFLTEVMSGRVKALRTDRADEKPIELLAVSKHGQYFIVAFKEQPFELWDLKNLTLLSTVSQNFKSITCLEWSPKSALKRKHSEQGDEISKQIDPIFLKPPTNDVSDEKSSRSFVKEHFLAVDSQSKVCFFTVEGSVLKSNMRILVPVSSAITCTAWKADKLVLGDLDGNLSLWDITTKKSEATPSQRGTVKRVSFAPGRGNMKLIVLFVDAVELWEATADHTMNRLASLRINKGEICHVDWADSVSPLLGWANGNISVMDMELKQCSTPIAELFFEEMPFLPSILNPNSTFHLKSVLQHLSEDVCSLDVYEATKDFKLREDTILARGMLADLDSDVWEGLSKSQTAQKAYLIAHLFGDEEAIRFWRMFKSRIDERQRLPTSFDLLLPQDEYRQQQLERAMLHESKRGSNYQLTQLCVDEFLLLGDADRAVQLLLETEPPNELFTHDALRACLIACLKKENKSQSVVKLVATNLIASGDTQLGVQLLCVIHKALDACRYLQSNGQWDKSIWLAKCSLAAEEVCEVMKKWADHLQLGGTNQRCRSALALLSIGEIVRCVEMLASNQMIERAVLLTEAAIESELELRWDKNKKEFRPPGLYLTYARYLHAIGNSEMALSYCMKALDIPEAEDLKKEIEILLDDAVLKTTS